MPSALASGNFNPVHAGFPFGEVVHPATAQDLSSAITLKKTTAGQEYLQFNLPVVFKPAISASGNASPMASLSVYGPRSGEPVLSVTDYQGDKERQRLKTRLFVNSQAVEGGNRLQKVDLFG